MGERVRAHCQHCGTTETLAADAVYSPDFSFWCPRCQSILIIEADGVPERPLARTRAAPAPSGRVAPVPSPAPSRSSEPLTREALGRTREPESLARTASFARPRAPEAASKPGERSETPDERPGKLAGRPETLAGDPGTLAGDPGTLAEQPERLAQHPETPTERRERPTDRLERVVAPLPQTQADSEEPPALADPRTRAFEAPRDLRASEVEISRAATPRVPLLATPADTSGPTPLRVAIASGEPSPVLGRAAAHVSRALLVAELAERIASKLSPDTTAGGEVKRAGPAPAREPAPVPVPVPAREPAPAPPASPPPLAPARETAPAPEAAAAPAPHAEPPTERAPSRPQPLETGNAEPSPLAAALDARSVETKGDAGGDLSWGPPEAAPDARTDDDFEPDALDEIAVVEISRTTRGTGSQTYDAEPKHRESAPPAPIAAPPSREVPRASPQAKASAPSTAPASPRPSTSGSLPRPASALEARAAAESASLAKFLESLPEPPAPRTATAASASPPALATTASTAGAPSPASAPGAIPATGSAAAGKGLARSGGTSGEDLDWFALIDEALPETAATTDSEGSRVIIRLPESMAPRSEGDAQQLRELQATLEARGLPPLADAAAAPGGDGAGADLDATRDDDDDTRSGPGAFKTPERGASERAGTDKPAPSPGDPNATAPLKKLAEASEARRASGRVDAPEDARPATELRPTPAPPTTIEQFNRADLDPSLVCARDPSSPEADTFKQLYQMIFHARPGSGFGPPPRIVLVTSARRGEGKTTVAANLAVVAARMPGRGALLISADPRGGDLLRVFGLGMKREGLLEALDGGGDPMRFVIKFKLGNLDVLPLGVPGSDAAELISSDRIGEVIHGLAARCPSAVVIIDGSSVLHAPDPLVLARQVDGVVLVVRADETSREDLERARDLLGAEKVLGVVLNQVAVGAA